MSSPSQRRIGPTVPCHGCGKELAASYMKTHVKKVCKTTPDDEVDKAPANVEKEKVSMTKPDDQVDKDTSSLHCAQNKFSTHFVAPLKFS